MTTEREDVEHLLFKLRLGGTITVDELTAAFIRFKSYTERALLRDFINSDHALHCQGDEAARRYARDLGYGDVGDQR
jgi:hypothetical protein